MGGNEVLPVLHRNVFSPSFLLSSRTLGEAGKHTTLQGGGIQRHRIPNGVHCAPAASVSLLLVTGHAGGRTVISHPPDDGHASCLHTRLRDWRGNEYAEPEPQLGLPQVLRALETLSPTALPLGTTETPAEATAGLWISGFPQGERDNFHHGAMRG